MRLIGTLLATFVVCGACAFCFGADAAGTINTFAGNGNLGFSGDDGPATSAQLFSPDGLATDKMGNMYIVDSGNHRIRKVTATGVITTVAGNGKTGFSGDGGPATSASFSPSFNGHLGIAVDNSGNLYIPDYGNQRVRKVDSSGVITTVAGNGTRASAGDGGPATSASLTDPIAVAVDSGGNLYIAEFSGNRVRMVTKGIITTFAGGGPLGFSNGDGGPATKAILNAPFALAFDPAGNLYIGDVTARRVRKVDTAGIITTVAGNGGNEYSGDGGPAIKASFLLTGVAADGAGNVFISDMTNRIRQVNTAGVINTIAGNGQGGYSGDGGPATNATINSPGDVAVDSSGNLYIADSFNMRVRKINGIAQPAAALAISSVVSGASFQGGIAANSWITIAGTNLSPVTDTWVNAIVDGKLPKSLDGVSVSVGGKPAYISYISSTQINAVAPNVAAGAAPVTVTTPSGTSSVVMVVAQPVQPAFFQWGSYAVATHQDYSLAVKSGTFPGLTTVPAKPGDVIILWGTGFGPTNPPAPVGEEVPSNTIYYTAANVTVTVGGMPATAYGTALSPGYAGLYQVAIQIPMSLSNGDYPVVATVSGVKSPLSTLITVQE